MTTTAPHRATETDPLRSVTHFPHWESATAEEILTEALSRWGRRVAIGTAFQAEGMAILDMAVRIDPGVRVFTIDTGRLPAESHHFIDEVRRHYGIEVEVQLPRPGDVEPLVQRFGTDLFRESVDLRLACCRARKVEPLARRLADLDAWITGLRRDQAPSRAGVPKAGIDPHHPGVIKLSPLADWNAHDVASYLTRHAVPRHPLYARGYSSIGCAPCTRPTLLGADTRSGRWWWEDEQPKECGLHWGPDGSLTRHNESTDRKEDLQGTNSDVPIKRS
ncbi:MAG: phosphoadenylyl-sulfate reductase [Thermoanaerobaculia bacterium]|nr:phosphoadenylyl-sulfate reductase [Thermoanaerobaculia bacterium]